MSEQTFSQEMGAAEIHVQWDPAAGKNLGAQEAHELPQGTANERERDIM